MSNTRALIQVDHIMSETTYKIPSVAEKYGIEDYDLERLWTGPDSMGLRDIAEQFNIKIVRGALAQVVEPEEEDPQYLFRVLTGDIGTNKTRNAKRRDLEEKGIDVDELQDDFISYSAVRRYLTEYKGVDKDTVPNESEAIENLRTTAEKLETRCRNVIIDHVERLNKRGILSIKDPSLVVDFNLYCEECEKELRFAEYIKRRECDCEK
jgi:hypothetical protein